MRNWKVVESTQVYQSGFMNLRTDKCELPDGRIMPRYYVMEFSDWVNVVALTKDGQALLVEQYRHAASEIFLEIPGGATDPRKKEDPRLAAERELLEETGYQAGKWLSVGFHYPNPATQTNCLHTYIAFDCEKVQEPQLDPFEDLSLKIMPVVELFEQADQGKISHSLILASLYLARSHLQDWL